MTAAPAAVDVVVALRALAEPHRLELVEALRERERCVRDLVDAVGLSQPLVSHHLGKLSAAGLVTSRHVDGFTNYSLDPHGLTALGSVLERLLDAASLPARARSGGNDSCCR